MFVFLRPVALVGQCHVMHERLIFRKFSTVTPISYLHLYRYNVFKYILAVALVRRAF